MKFAEFMKNQKVESIRVVWSDDAEEEFTIDDDHLFYPLEDGIAIDILINNTIDFIPFTDISLIRVSYGEKVK